MTIKEFLSVLDIESIDSIVIIKDNEILWSDTELTTIPQNFLDITIKLVSPQHNTEYYENYDGEMCECGSELSVVIEIVQETRYVRRKDFRKCSKCFKII